jgi:alpha,alpha-trehalase
MRKGHARCNLAAAVLTAAAFATCLPAAAQPVQSRGTREAGPSAERRSPADRYGALFVAVQTGGVFPDGKSFVDLVPRPSVEAVLRAYAAEKPATREQLRAFVAHHFHDPTEPPSGRASLRDRIRSLWPVLARPPMASAPGSSALDLPHAYVVAGGRFREMYYWDSYFTMLGLKADGEHALIEAMLANFVALVRTHGHVPNGTRSYYLSRSQPPFLALMMDLSDNADNAVAAERLAALRAEHRYWMAGASCVDADGACRHVVRMPDGALLNRYWDARDTPRDESYAEDVATAKQAAPRPAPLVYRDLRAGAESGWDFGSRWLRDGKTLATIRTTDIVPVDLNSLLWNLERSITRRCAALDDAPCAADYERQAEARRAAITSYLWSATEQRFADWDRTAGQATPVISAVALYPLFVGLATPDQAAATARLVEARLLAPGGLRTTTERTGEQWDAPNGWAPLLWIGVQGLARYGHAPLADELADRWLRTVSAFHACTGRLVEKYDVESGLAGAGGEYPVQDGFGWTNGVTRALLDRPGADAVLMTRCPAARTTPRPSSTKDFRGAKR